MNLFIRKIPETLVDIHLIDGKGMSDLVNYARINKVLYVLGLYEKRLRDTPYWRELCRRRVEQRKSIIEVVDIAENLGLRILIVKTLKPFPYVPDDVDILVVDNDINQLVTVLRQKGYQLLKIGTPEVTLRKVVNRTYVDLDIHIEMGAGPYKYISKQYLWRRHTYKVLSDRKVPVPNDVDELLITIAHSVLKEFSINLADIFHVIFTDGETLSIAYHQSTQVGLSKAFKFTSNIAVRVIQSVSKDSKNSSKRELLSLFPMRVHPLVIASSYVENLSYRLRFDGINPFKELIKAPSSKGIGKILRYIGL
jgi:hypothetical protein